MILNCGVGEDSWESLRLQWDLTNPEGNHSWIFIGRTDAEAETPILWPPVVKNWLIGKDPDAGKDGRPEEKWMTEDEMVGWHHHFNGHGFGWTLRVVDAQGSLGCCSTWGHKESDPTEQLNWTELMTQTVKNPPSTWETCVWSLGCEDPLENGMATHSSILPWTKVFFPKDKGASPQGLRCLVGYSPWGHKESDMTEGLNIHIMFMDQKN